MNGAPDRRFLIVVLVFGIVGGAAGIRWLHEGSIVIRQGSRRGMPAAGHSAGPVAGRIDAEHVAYYPLCATWIGLGASMVVLSISAFVTSHPILLRLSTYSALAILALGFTTVGAALWYGK